ncbi:MAG TPA: OmpA family protein [Ohtaekwangia sp.]|uniref:OmpA family protein n=1 Tax=Ohtaekwangia sp. TaxID=2066019 RepID=UPI002F94AA1E
MDKLLYLTLLVFGLAIPFCGQSQNLIEKGDRLFAKKDYENALKSYLEAGPGDDAMTNFKIGLCYLYTEVKSKSLPYLQKAVQAKSNVDEDIDYYLGMAYQNNHQYAKARDHYEAFRSKNKKLYEIATQKIYECEIGDSLTRKPVRAVIQNVGGGINTAFNEYSPLVSSDGQTMIFTSNRSTDDYKIKSGTNFEDIYIARKTGDTWGAPEKISPNINIKFNDAAASLSADGKTLFLYYEDGAGDIYTSHLEAGEWTKPEPLNKNINTPLFWETSACISADGQKLFFSSNRPGGKGELDIWMSTLDAKGNWAKPVNLGSAINTPGNEDSPFIHPDGVTLYFSSDGHPSMGSNDIFKSEYKDGKWQRPVNLGYPVNSIEYDGFFSISEDKKTGYYSTLRAEGLGSADIYTITFLPPAKEEKEPVLLASTEPSTTTIEVRKEEPKVEVPKEEPKVEVPKEEPKKEEPKVETPPVVTPPPVTQPVVAETKPTDNFVDPSIQAKKDLKVVTILRGKVIDETTAQPLGATIFLVDNISNKVVTKMYSDPQTGDFEITIPHGGNYGVSTERDGYLFNSINFSLPEFAEYQEIDTHIIMVKAEVGSKVVLKNIFFDIGKSDLKAESLAEVENIKELLITNPNLNVQINGHTDNTGNAETNKALSLKRATAVVTYLIEHGIDSARLSAKGYGSERPIVSNDDEEGGRAINRRTEIEIIESKG